MAIASLLTLLLYAFMICLLVRAVFSWIEPFPRNGIHRVAFNITEPVLAPVRRLVPPFGGFDVSFILVWVGILLLLGLVSRI
jgi:YggT family protein